MLLFHFGRSGEADRKFFAMRKSRLLSNCAILSLAIGQSYNAWAGWTGVMNGLGVGRASVNVTSATQATALAPTPVMTEPSAAINPLDGFAVGAPLPNGSSAATSANVKGKKGYIWTASTFATGGDRTDNSTIQSLVTVVPQSIAYLTMNLSAQEVASGLELSLFGTATGGTALLVRGFSWTGPNPPTDQDIQGITQFAFTQWVIGQGVSDPSLGENQPSLYQTRPINIGDVDLATFYIVTDGYATSAVPESGKYLGAAFALTFAGMAAMRQRRSSAA